MVFFTHQLYKNVFLFAQNFKNQVERKVLAFIKRTKFLGKIKLAGRAVKPFKNSNGQVIVEYILLLVVSAVMALLLVNLVSVDPNKTSPVFSYWKHLIEVVGSDVST